MVLQQVLGFLGFFSLWKCTYSWLMAKLLRKNFSSHWRTGKILLFGATQWTMSTRTNGETEAIMAWSRELEITAGTMETPEPREEGSKASCPVPDLLGSWLKEYGQMLPFLKTVLYPEIWVSISMENTLWLSLPLHLKWAYRAVREQSFAINRSHQKG